MSFDSFKMLPADYSFANHIYIYIYVEKLITTIPVEGEIY